MLARCVGALAFGLGIVFATSGATLAGNAPLITIPGQFGVGATGAATYSLPIAVPPGTAGMLPAVSLNYSSQNRDGIVGWGWSLGYGPAAHKNAGDDDARGSGRQPGNAQPGFENTDGGGAQSYSPSSINGALSGGGDTGMITRCAQTVAQDSFHGGVRYDLNDRFCLNGQRLILISGTYGYNGSEYRTEIDGFTKIIAHGQVGNSWGWFEVRTKNGQRLEFGNTTDSQVNATGLSTSRAWALNKAYDTKGNYLTVTYTQDTTNAEIYPHYIDYTGNGAVSPYNRVEFVYTTRADQTPYYQAGILQRMTLHLSEIKTLQGGSLVLDYKLVYREGTDVIHSRLTSVTMCDATTTTCLPATTFDWQGGNATMNFTMAAAGMSDLLAPTLLVGDYDGDGLLDVAQGQFLVPPLCYRGTTSGALVAPGSGFNCPPVTGNLSGSPSYAVADFNADGLSDLFDLLIHPPYSSLINTGSSYSSIASPWVGQAYYGGDYNGDDRSDIFTDASESTSGNTALWLSTGSGTFAAGTTPVITAYYPSTGDFDGDGCSDVMWGNRGTIPPVASLNITYYCRSTPSTSTMGVTFALTNVFGDFNGDGKTDLLVGCAYGTSPCTGATIYLSTGTGFVSTGYNPATLAVAQFGAALSGFIYADVNGDGRTDVIAYAYSGTGGWPHLTNNVAVYLSTGTGLVAAGLLSIGDGNLAGAAADWNGDGASDFMSVSAVYPTQDVLQAAYISDAVPEQIVKISNGIGATTNVAYGRLNQNAPLYTKGTGATYPIKDVDNSMSVVSEVDASNGLGACVPPSTTNCYITSYTYAGAKADSSGRGFLGFTTVTATDHETGVVQTTMYRTDFPYAGLIASQTSTTSYTRNGCVAGNIVKSVVNTYNTVTPTVPATPLFIGLQQSVSSGTDCEGSVLPEVTRAYTYDAYGSVTQATTIVRLSGVISSTGITSNTFSNDTTNWLFLPTDTATTNTVGSSTVTRTMSFGYVSGTDFLNRKTVEPSSSTLLAQTDYVLDAFGNPTTITTSGSGASSCASTLTYTTNGEFVTSVTTCLSFTDHYTNDPNFGGLASHTDPNSLTTIWTYDGFGRKSHEVRPDGTYVDYFFYPAPGGPNGSVVETGAFFSAPGGAQNAPFQVAYLDTLGRSVYEITNGFSAYTGRVINYNTAGQIWYDSGPYQSSVGWTISTYDDLGRVKTVTAPDGGVTSKVYHGLATLATDPLSRTSGATRNPQGYNATVTDAAGQSTTYVYDAFGNVTSITDPLGNITTNTYDVRGNKTASTDRDMGTLSYTYDGLGRLKSQTDAKSQTTTLNYDLLGRMISRVEPDLTSTWSWDTATHGIGLLASASATGAATIGGGGYSRTLTYDSLSRPIQTRLSRVTIGINYDYYTTYNADNGKIDTVTYPSGFVAKYIYNTSGYLTQIKDNTSGAAIYTVVSRDKDLHLTQGTYGNGVTLNNTYDTTTGLLTNVRASSPGGTPDDIASFDYLYDLVGNTTYRADGLQGTFERYCYDNLNRLTKTALAVGSDPGTNCAALGGTVKTVSYDVIGNITAKSDVGTYSYPASGSSSVRPHAIASITGTVNGVTNPTYTYDANGNMLTGAGRTVTYNSFNMASAIAEGSDTNGIIYDSEHFRVRSTPSATTRMFYPTDPVSGSMEEILYQANATTLISTTDYIQVDGHNVAQRVVPSGGSPAMNYFVIDALGSISTATDQTGLPSGTHTERDAYDPWGKRRNLNGTDDTTCSLTSISNRGYTGHEHITRNCLINANARVYDPTVARFMSPDDIVADIYDGQGLNRYTYVDNRPMSLTDPTGHFGCFGSDVGCNIAAFNDYVKSQGGWGGLRVDDDYSGFSRSEYINIGRFKGFWWREIVAGNVTLASVVPLERVTVSSISMADEAKLKQQYLTALNGAEAEARRAGAIAPGYKFWIKDIYVLATVVDLGGGLKTYKDPQPFDNYADFINAYVASKNLGVIGGLTSVGSSSSRLYLSGAMDYKSFSGTFGTLGIWAPSQVKALFVLFHEYDHGHGAEPSEARADAYARMMLKKLGHQ